MAKPRTTNDPEAQEIWPMTLQEAIRIGLDNSEVVRVISLGAQGIPIGGFEPTPLNTGAGSALGAGTLATVYDPAIQETQIAQALSTFDAALTTSLFWGHSDTPFNNGFQAGAFTQAGSVPVVFIQDTAQFQAAVQKRTATGAQLGVTHNINYHYSNSPNNVFPSAYTTNTQLQLIQPLLGSAPLPGQQAGPPVRPGGQPRADRHRPAQRRRRGLAVQGGGHGQRPLHRAAILEPLPAAGPALEQRDGGRARRGDPQARAVRARGRPRHACRRRRGRSSSSSSSASTS